MGGAVVRVVLGAEDFEDVRGVHDVISTRWVEHEMRPLEDALSPPRFQMVGFGPVRVAQMHLGAAAVIDSGHGGALSVNVPLAGRLETSFGSTVVDSGVGQATVNAPGEDLHSDRWDCPLLAFRVEEEFLRREHERVLGRPARRLERQIDLGSPEARDWFGLVRGVFDQALTASSDLFEAPALAEQVASTLTTGLLLAVSPEGPDDRLGTRPRIVRRVLEAIEEDPAHPWTPVELAERAGVSVRRLQQGFREYVGRTPFQYLRDVRLDRAHQDLVHAGDDTTVTDVALRWGFGHTGRFAADYRDRFGRTPSETLHH